MGSAPPPGVTSTTARRATDADRCAAALTDPYTCRILVALRDGPRAAADLAADCEASRSTVYRRLNRLASLGLVTTRTEGVDRTWVRLRLSAVEIELDGDGRQTSATFEG